MTDRIIAVVGFARCGTSLTMRMLHHGGVEVVADNHASYEDGRANCLNDSFVFLHECRGRAVKLLEPGRMHLPDLPYDFIWLRRSSIEQAKSQRKILRALAGMDVPESDVQKVAAGIVRDTPGTIRHLAGLPGARLMEVWFERLISYPREEAQKISVFIRRQLDVDKMVAQVRPRGTRCLEGFLELEFLEREEAKI